MRGWILPLLLASCGPVPLTGEDVCDDVVLAVAARVATCADDPAAAEGAEDLFDHLDCLPADLDDEEIEVWVRGYYDCVGAMSSVPCDSALEYQDLAAFWLAQDFHCAQIWGDESDTGVTP